MNQKKKRFGSKIGVKFDEDPKIHNPCTKHVLLDDIDRIQLLISVCYLERFMLGAREWLISYLKLQG